MSLILSTRRIVTTSMHKTIRKFLAFFFISDDFMWGARSKFRKVNFSVKLKHIDEPS